MCRSSRSERGTSEASMRRVRRPGGTGASSRIPIVRRWCSPRPCTSPVGQKTTITAEPFPAPAIWRAVVGHSRERDPASAARKIETETKDPWHLSMDASIFTGDDQCDDHLGTDSAATPNPSPSAWPSGPHRKRSSTWICSGPPSGLGLPSAPPRPVVHLSRVNRRNRSSTSIGMAG